MYMYTRIRILYFFLLRPDRQRNGFLAASSQSPLKLPPNISCFVLRFSTGVPEGGRVRAGGVLLFGGDVAPAVAAAGEDLAFG